MERGSSKHSPREDDALVHELAGQLGPGGSNREEWVDPEPPADDDPPSRVDLSADSGSPDSGAVPDEDEMRRAQHDMAVANDWDPGEDRV
jgi:hypothetical protein